MDARLLIPRPEYALSLLEFANAIPTSILISAGLGVIRIVWNSRRDGAKLLPAPPSIPALGNLHLLKGNPMTCLEDWSKKLGPNYRFRNGGEYGDNWIKLRRFFTDALGQRRLPLYLEQINSEARFLIKYVSTKKSTPIDPTMYIMLLTFNVTMKILADYRIDDPNDPELLEELELQTKHFHATYPASNPVELQPFLKVFPQSWVTENRRRVGHSRSMRQKVNEFSGRG
ncbi:hypothetical protein BZG36_05031 [Bifiguratus adelaidae]|uniref:Cytochrome P450 n=1 Tax=Bifiguratus adelaidae TaxID=1938954 RepID=A0A261XVJ3_9FUNG|nr:hypothetical protein BZG36_05031 [Bifiguratus adelaidae]